MCSENIELLFWTIQGCGGSVVGVVVLSLLKFSERKKEKKFFWRICSLMIGLFHEVKFYSLVIAKVLWMPSLWLTFQVQQENTCDGSAPISDGFKSPDRFLSAALWESSQRACNVTHPWHPRQMMFPVYICEFENIADECTALQCFL